MRSGNWLLNGGWRSGFGDADSPRWIFLLLLLISAFMVRVSFCSFIIVLLPDGSDCRFPLAGISRTCPATP